MNDTTRRPERDRELRSGELVETLSDPSLELVRAAERRAVRLGTRQYVVGRGAGSKTRVEVDQRGRPRAGATRHQGRPGQPVKRRDVLAGQVEVHDVRRVGDDVG